MCVCVRVRVRGCVGARRDKMPRVTQGELPGAQREGDTRELCALVARVNLHPVGVCVCVCVSALHSLSPLPPVCVCAYVCVCVCVRSERDAARHPGLGGMCVCVSVCMCVCVSARAYACMCARACGACVSNEGLQE